jgi:hypothetical protein
MRPRSRLRGKNVPKGEQQMSEPMFFLCCLMPKQRGGTFYGPYGLAETRQRAADFVKNRGWVAVIAADPAYAMEAVNYFANTGDSRRVLFAPQGYQELEEFAELAKKLLELRERRTDFSIKRETAAANIRTDVMADLPYRENRQALVSPWSDPKKKTQEEWAAVFQEIDLWYSDQLKSIVDRQSRYYAARDKIISLGKAIEEMDREIREIEGKISS